MTSTTRRCPAVRRSTPCRRRAAGAGAQRTAASNPFSSDEPDPRQRRFGAVQLEFGFLLGPENGRYLIRSGADAPAERVIVLATLSAPQRRLFDRGRRRRSPEQPAPAPVPTARATIARAEPFEDEATASDWLASLRRKKGALEGEMEESVAVLNRVIRAHRAAVADPYVREVSADQALVRRVGHGEGALIAGGRLDASVEVPDAGRRRRRAELLSPQERLAAILGGREALLACEDLVLRARLDLDSARGREAALQARIALEALLAELGESASESRGDREGVGAAANAALDGELGDVHLATVQAAVERMERALTRRRAGGH